MPLNDTYPLAVTFIIGPITQKDGSTKLAPIGTGFVLNMPSRLDNLRFEYIVTASHVVYEAAETYARFRTKDGGLKDVQIHEWVHHARGADVAMTPFRADTDLHLLNIPVSALTADGPWRPNLGERVYFLGLLAMFEDMAERNVPMVRSGTIGALDQKDVPVDFSGAPRRIDAHLIDCRSYGGFGGSPCFFQRDHPVVSTSLPVPPVHATLLLGLVYGHFDMWKATRVKGDLAYEPGSVEAPLNTGVGLITPAEKILEVLMMEELAEERDRIEQKHNAAEPEGATLDKAGETEFERFERLARKIMQVPKKELDEVRRRDQ